MVSQVDLYNLFTDAYQWLCKQRKKHPPSSDIWDVRQTWNSRNNLLMNKFITGTYRFDVQKKITLSSGETIALWSSCDALIIKVLTFIIQHELRLFLSKTCYHLKGHGGLKGAVKDVAQSIHSHTFFCKTDVKLYYDSIDHFTLFMKLYTYINDRMIMDYVWQFLTRCVEWGGLYQDIKRGLPRASSLSPLLGAFYLLELDRKMEKLDVKYIRYMDDILILASTRWKLKKAIRVLNQTLNELILEKHPDKTLIGRTERGFNFLGYFIKPGLLTVSQESITRFTHRIARLSEQGADVDRIGQYMWKWGMWVNSFGACPKPQSKLRCRVSVAMGFTENVCPHVLL